MKNDFSISVKFKTFIKRTLKRKHSKRLNSSNKQSIIKKKESIKQLKNKNMSSNSKSHSFLLSPNDSDSNIDIHNKRYSQTYMDDSDQNDRINHDIPTSSNSLYYSENSTNNSNENISIHDISNIPSFITPSNHMPGSSSYLLPNSNTTNSLSASFNNLNNQTFHAPTMVPVHNLNPNVPLPRFNSRRRLSYPLNAVISQTFSNTSFPAPITPFNNSVAPSITNLSPEKHIDKSSLDPKLIIFMVGLPARGKSYICQKLRRYLAWIGYKTRIFNVGNKRRVAHLNYQQTKVPGTKHDANFFDPSNTEYSSERDLLALETLEELITWLKKGGNVGIHDATNSTKKRRELLMNRCRKEPNVITMFVESICTDKDVIERNVSMKLRSPDYINMDPEQAIADFKARMANYEKAYEPVSEETEGEEISYIKSINVGRKVTGYNIHGFLCSQCVFYLMNIHIKERTIWLTRHGESVYNLCNRIGGDSPLTEFGRRYSQALARFVQSFHPPDECSDLTRTEYPKESYGPLSIWTSNLRRSRETAESFDQRFNIKNVRFLNEIYSGIYENMTMEEIQQTNPEDFAARQANKLVYRYPGAGGESYIDVIDRLRPGIIELERMETSVLIVTHNVIMRTLLAYFTGIDLQEMPSLNIPLHTLYCLKPKPYGAELIKYRYNSMTDSFERVE